MEQQQQVQYMQPQGQQMMVPQGQQVMMTPQGQQVMMVPQGQQMMMVPQVMAPVVPQQEEYSTTWSQVCDDPLVGLEVCCCYPCAICSTARLVRCII